MRGFYPKMAVCLICSLLLPWGTIAAFGAMATLEKEKGRWDYLVRHMAETESFATPAEAVLETDKTQETFETEYTEPEYEREETQGGYNVATSSQSVVAGAESVVTGSSELIDSRAELLRELTSSMSVSLPTELSFNIDLYDVLGKGQIYSPDYCFQNFSKVDVRIRITSIFCEFSSAGQFQSLESVDQMDRSSNKKLIYMYLEQQNGKPEEATAPEAQMDSVVIGNIDAAMEAEEETEREQGLEKLLSDKPGIVITDVPNVDEYAFILSADPADDNNQIRFRLLGEVNELSKYSWHSGEVRIKAQFAIEPLVDEALAELDAEIARREAMMYEEIPDEEDLYEDMIPETEPLPDLPLPDLPEHIYPATEPEGHLSNMLGVLSENESVSQKEPMDREPPGISALSGEMNVEEAVEVEGDSENKIDGAPAGRAVSEPLEGGKAENSEHDTGSEEATAGPGVLGKRDENGGDSESFESTEAGTESSEME